MFLWYDSQSVYTFVWHDLLACVWDRLPTPIVLHTVLQWGSAKGPIRNPHGLINMNVLTRILIISCIYFIHHLTPFPSIICRLKAYRPMLFVCIAATLNKFLFLFFILILAKEPYTHFGS